MIMTYGELRKVLKTISLDNATSTQKKNHVILTDWASEGHADGETFLHPQRIDMAVKNLQKVVVRKKVLVKMNSITLEKTNTIFNALKDRLEYLYGRWQDEKKYENFNEYIANLKALFETVIVEHKSQNAVFVKIGKRPFGITFDFEGWRVVCSCNSKHIGWTATRI